MKIVNCAEGFVNAATFGKQDSIVLWPTLSLRRARGLQRFADFCLANDAGQYDDTCYVPVGYNNDGMVVTSISPEQLDNPSILWVRVIYSVGEKTWYIYPVSSWWFKK